MSSNTNIGNTPVNQGYVQLIHTGETGGIDGTLRTLYDGDGTASDLQIASNKVKVSTELYIGSKTATEFIQDIVGDMFTTGSYTNITTTYDDTNGNIDLSASGEVTLTGTQTLTNKTLASPTFTGTANGANLTLTGDLTVSGDTIFTNSNNVLIGDAILTLNADETGSPTANAGFEVERGTSTNKSFVWNETDDKWTIGSETFVAGTVEANLTGNVTGNVTGSASLNLLTSNNLSDLTNASTARTNLGLVIGTDVQAYDAGLQSISGLTTAADKMIYTTASDTYAVTALTSTARTLLDDTSIGAMRTTLGLGTLATQNTIDFDDIDGTAYITSAEAFSDSDLQLMTAAAIDDLIVSKGYGTGNGDITAVTAGVGIGGGGLSGDVDLTFEGSELPDMTDLMLSTDEFVVLDGTTSKRKAISEIRLTAFDDTGFTSGISFNGSTANGLLTYGNSTTADVEDNLTFDGTLLHISKETSTTGTTGTTLLKLTNDVGSDLSQQKTFVDFALLDDNSNETPQVRIGAEVGQNGDANTQQKEGSGAFVVYTNNADTTSGDAGASLAERMRVDYQGRVGIGATTVDDGNLQIGDANSAFNIAIAGPRTKFGYDGSNAIVQGGTAKGIAFCVNNTTLGSGEAMRINSSGNVGIGTTSPQSKLEVKTAIDSINTILSAPLATIGNLTAYLNYQDLEFRNNYVNTTGTAKVRLRHHSNLYVNSGSQFSIATSTTGGTITEALRVDHSQNVGIGTSSPSMKLNISHGDQDGLRFNCTSTTGEAFIDFGDSGDNDAGSLRYDHNDNSMKFRVNASERARIVNTGAFHVTNDVVAFSSTPSDQKLKTNVKDIEYGLDTIMKLKPKQYDWKKDNRKDIGFIAQEVEEVIPEIVKDNEWFDDKIKTMDYEKLTAVLIKAVQEQQQQINELKEKLNG